MVLVALAGDRFPSAARMSFDLLAPHYRWMEALLAGGLLQRCRTRWLGEVRQARRALLAGEGNGRFLGVCASALPGCHFTALDESEAMLAQARRRWLRAGGNGQVAFQRADLRVWRSGGDRFDLVVTNFFLDCFSPEELLVVIQNLGDAAAPRAQWLLADFTVPVQGWRRFRAQAVLCLAYGFFRLATGIAAKRITRPDEAFQRVGFSLRRRASFNGGLLHADLWVRDGN